MRKVEEQLQEKLLIVQDLDSPSPPLPTLLSRSGFAVTTGRTARAIDTVARESPDLVLLNSIGLYADGLRLCAHLKSNPLTSHIPLMVIGQRDSVEERLRWHDSGVEVCMDATHQIPEVAARIRAVLRRILDRDELTQLPSPLYLHRVLDIWLANNLPTAVLYVRVDHWDEFNSTFGADAWNLLLVVARLLVDALPQADTMASHLGGCDLMAILPRRGAETVAQTLLERYRSLDLPTATLSIAMVTNRHRALVNYVQVSTLLHGLMREVQARGGNGWACD